VKNEEVLRRIKEERNMIQIKRRKVNWIGQILRRIYLVKMLLKDR
jgi:hypothetical protein